MFSTFLAVALLSAAFAEPADLSEIAASVVASSDSSDGSFCLLQREQSHIRRGDEKAAETSPKALAAADDSASGQNSTQEELPQRNETALPQLSSLRDSSGTGSSNTAIGSSAPSQAWHAVPITAGVTDGMGLDYSAQALSQVSIKRSPRGQSADVSAEPPAKNKIVLMVIEMFPICWLFAIDRFYLGNIGLGIAKLAVSLGTCFVGGVVWGLVDFVIIVHSALRQETFLNAAGMKAKFPESQSHMGFILAIVDILMIPALIGLARFVWWWRKQQRMQRLKEAAMRNPMVQG